MSLRHHTTVRPGRRDAVASTLWPARSRPRSPSRTASSSQIPLMSDTQQADEVAMRSIDHPRRTRRARVRRDEGISFVEILVCVVLIGTTVVATLTALRVSIIGGTVHRDHANAHAWLQSASDVLYAREKFDCTTTLALTTARETTSGRPIRRPSNAVPNPEDWTNSPDHDHRHPVVELAGLGPGRSDVEFYFGTECQDAIGTSRCSRSPSK